MMWGYAGVGLCSFEPHTSHISKLASEKRFLGEGHA